MKSRGLLAAACAVVLMAGCNTNQRAANETATTNEPAGNAGTAGTAGAGVSSSDKNWVNDQLSGGMAEVELARLAKEHAASAEVKQFGERMVKDHSAANDKLTHIATQKGVTAASDMDASSKREYDKLSKLSGAKFDQEYMKSMVSDHAKDVKEFQSESKSAKDPDVKTFVQSTLPTLEEHLKLAKTAQAAAKGEKTALK